MDQIPSSVSSSPMMVRERLGNEEQSVLKAEVATRRDLLYEEVSGVLLSREVFWIYTGRTRVVRGRHVPNHVLVWSFRVVFALEGVERALLRRRIGSWWADGRALQGAAHAFVRAVLLWSSRMNALMLNAAPHPPHIELRQAMDTGRGERHAIVGADRQGLSMLTKGALEERLDADTLRRE